MTALNLDLLFVGLKSRMSNFTPFCHHQTRAVCCCDKPLRFCRFMVEFFVAVRSNFSQGSSNLTEVWYAPRKLALKKICWFVNLFTLEFVSAKFGFQNVLNIWNEIINFLSTCVLLNFIWIIRTKITDGDYSENISLSDVFFFLFHLNVRITPEF